MPFNSIFSWLIKKRMHQIELFTKYPLEVQHELMTKLVSTAQDTEWGKTHGFSEVDNYEKFHTRFAIQEYDDVKPYIDRIFNGEQNLLWPSEIKWFAKSSGTTNDKFKLIPVSKETLEECHYKGGKDLLCLYYHNHPNRKLYKGKHLIIGGSAQINYTSSDSYFGDLSAIIIKNLPFWAEIRRIPKKEIALLDKWDQKIEQMAQSTIKEDVYIVAGVPSWTLHLFKRILEITGKDNIADVWPNIELFMHGGVSFVPYRDQFTGFIRKPEMNYVETYNASEGFFGIQDQVNKDEMLLMLDYGIFYEFIPHSEFQKGNTSKPVWLDGVKTGENYVMVISTNSGLWRYVLGDTITFTSTNPFRFKITGRTRHFINAFGEELIIDNAEKAIHTACERTGASIREYTASPVFMGNNNTGGHQWLIEFEKLPANTSFFGEVLDNALKTLNSDYEAKRSHNFIMQPPVITLAKPNLFYDWLKHKGKLGGQHKIPRLVNNRLIMDELLELNK
ncbi:MAG TPA: GH3 auxin-responsive promoter family protein [Flavobacteriales bacterium]|nr:GH3 auxin-responsive promoter family protein [Flavobacteriales bacterium]